MALYNFDAWSHETGHNQDSVVFLNGEGRRVYGGGEDYADGNTSQGFGDGSINFNLAYEYGSDSSVTTNLTPERIDSSEKIHDYYRKMFEALDYLEYAEAKAFLTLTPEQQAAVCCEVYYPNIEGGTAETDPSARNTTGYRRISADKIRAMNLKTVADLWDNRITIVPGVWDAPTVRGVNKYGGPSIYTRRWYQPHNDLGRPDSFSLKALAWEMLGAGGYDGGYIAYYSNRHKNDLAGLRAVTGNPAETWRSYKQGRYALMEEHWDDVAGGGDALVAQYRDALVADAAKGDRAVSRSTNVMRRTYHQWKRATDDFRGEFFGSASSAVKVSSAQELVDKLTADPAGAYVLGADIDLSGVDASSGAVVPAVFMGSLDGAGHSLTGAKAPVFSGVRHGSVRDLVLEGSVVSSADGSRTGALAPAATGATVSGVLVRDTQVSGSSEAAGLFGRATSTTFVNCHGTNLRVSAGSRSGGLAGYVESGSTLKECSVDAVVTGNGGAVGGLVGELVSSDMRDCLSVGSVKSSHDMGGLVGYVNGGWIESCHSAASVEATNGNRGGSLVGQTVGNSTVVRCAGLGNAKNAYKFDGATGQAQTALWKENVEYAETSGSSTLARSLDLGGKLSVLTKAQLCDRSFWTGTLGWSEEVWDFSAVADEGAPVLKACSVNASGPLVKRNVITTAEEFEAMAADPSGIYELGADIDFGGRSYNGAVIAATFSGNLDGKGHSLLNLSGAALFQQFNGTAKNLRLSGFQNVSTGDNRGAFAVFTTGARIADVFIDDVTLKGRHRVAPLSTTDRDSVIERVSATNVTVTSLGNGVYGSCLLGRKTGGTLVDCYVQGTLTCSSTECAGVLGASEGSGSVERVVSNVVVDHPASNDARKQNAGFVGNIYGSTTFADCAFVGRCINSSGAEVDLWRFSGADAGKASQLSNCWEATGDGWAFAPEVERIDGAFWSDVLKLPADRWEVAGDSVSLRRPF